MGILDRLRRWIAALGRLVPPKDPSVLADKEIEALLDAAQPPRDMHDRKAWDDFWLKHLDYRAREQPLADAMAGDDLLPTMLRRRGARTILCAGNGLSFEAVDLALLGFEVTALDLSDAPVQLLDAPMRDPSHPVWRFPGFRVTRTVR